MYVPDDSVLGNPGIFGFVGKAVKGVVKAVGSAIGIQGVPKISIPAPIIQVVPTPAAAQAAVTGAVQGLPPWVIPAAAAAAGILVVTMVAKGRR